MTATSQHGLHPDAESLSAFSEQALSARERADVLAHLAVCGRCRRVVALARKAAEAAAAAQTRKTIAPNAWWRQWRFVWVPAGVAVAFAVTTISVMIERADRHDAEIKIVAQNPVESTPPTATPPPTEQAKVEPPAAPAPPPAHSAKHEHTAAAEPLPAPAPPAVTAQMPPASRASAPEPMDRVAVMPEAHPPFHAQEQQVPPELVAGGMRPAYSQPDTGAQQASQEQAELQRQAEEQHQAEAESSRRRVLKSKAAPAVVHGTNASPPADASQTVAVAVSPTEAQPVEVAEPAPMPGIESSPEVSTSSKPMQLPSGRTAVSTASGGHLLLAVDKAGSLFLSEDQGATWERIPRQWKGRAVEVRQQVQLRDALPAAPPAQSGTTGNSSFGASSGPSITTFFELSNDKNQMWVSTDGRTWTPK